MARTVLRSIEPVRARACFTLTMAACSLTRLPRRSRQRLQGLRQFPAHQTGQSIAGKAEEQRLRIGLPDDAPAYTLPLPETRT